MQRIATIFLFLYCTVLIGQNLEENSTGSFIFTPELPLERPPVEVFYHIPQGDLASMPILMSFHGSSRNGADFRNFWIDMADENGFMVFAPEFSSTNYPGLGDNYIMSNIFDDGDNPSPESFNDQNEWTCSILDPLFDHIKADISGDQVNYSTWGHSAGAQFLHRLFMYLPSSKINVAVCSNAGWYTVPEGSVSFPYGTLDSQLPQSDLTNAFSKKLLVHLGEDDTVPSTSPGGPRDNPTVNSQQGFNRLERGQYFYITSQSFAQDLGISFNWEIQEVANVGHDAQLMANDALQYLLPFLLSTKFLEKNYFSLTPNPVISGNIEIKAPSDDILSIEIFNMLGKCINKASALPNSILDVSHLDPGIYIVLIEQNSFIASQKLVIQ